MNEISKEKMVECIHTLISADRLRRKCFERNLKSLGIHHTQHRVLMYIARHDGLVNQKQIADKFDVSPAAVVGIIKKLESNGYITKCILETDNRFNKIDITEKGKHIIDVSRSVFESLDKKSFEYFSEDEIDKLIELLTKMKKSLNEWEGE